MANAGRVAIVPKGDYSSSTAYKRLDLVRYNEKAYVAKKANTGVAPTNTEYWMLMTSDGITIDTALSDTSTNPVQNKVVKTALDNIQTTSRAALSTTGWYRVAKVTGAAGSTVILKVGNVYAHSGSDEHLLLFTYSYGNAEFSTISSKATNAASIFSKARYTVEGTNSYLEVYFSVNTEEPVNCTVLSFPDWYGNSWKALDFIPTSETVDGVTVYTTYDIPANASPVTDLDLAQVDGTALLTTSILAKAVELADGFHSYRLGGSSYTGSDLPATEYRYSSAKIYKRGSNSIVVVLYPNANGTAKKIQYNIYESSWLGWNELSTTSDLTTALAGYLPLVGGGILDGNLYVGKGEKEEIRTFVVRNKNRQINLQVLADGTFRFYDATNNEGLMNFAKDGTNTFYGTASGNLPLTGGKITNNVTVPLLLENTNDTMTFINFLSTQGNMGYLGFYGKDNPVVIGSDGSTTKNILHSGNSAKVAIQSSAPTDTSALWVDTANKVNKAYIDGAWTAMA